MAYKQYSKEEKAAYKEKKKAEMDKMIEEIDNGIKEMFTSEKYKQYLDTVSKFHKYSLNNTILIMFQNPDASLVAGYKKWESMGRHVKKGEKGITVLAPQTGKQTVEREEVERDEHGNPILNDDGTEKKKIVKTKTTATYMSFKAVSVFDISQTEGKDLPLLVSPIPETVTEEYANAVSTALDNLTKVKHEREHLAEGHNGYCDYKTNRIVLSDTLNYDMQIRTHIHETAHYLLHGKDGSQKERSKEQREMQAESVAYIVSKRLGLDTSDYSFGYIGTWGNKDLTDLKTILRDTTKATELIYNRIDEGLKELRARKLEQTAAESIEQKVEPQDKGAEDVPTVEQEKTESERKVGSVQLGDVFKYEGREVTVTQMSGIYPDDVVISCTNTVGGTSYVTEQNIDRFKLASIGDFLYNENDISLENEEILTREVIDYHNNEFTWIYYNPDGNDSKGQFYEMHIDDYAFKEAFKKRMLTEKVYGYDKGLETFMEVLQYNSEGTIIDNDGSKGYAEYMEMFKADGHDLTIDAGLDSNAKNKCVYDYFLAHSALLCTLERNATKEGTKPLRTDVATLMWENGFTIYDSEFNEITPYDYSNLSANDYGAFEGVKDFTLYASHNDFHKQQLFDEISECVEAMADSGEYALYDCYDEYDWNGYDDNRSITENVQDALRRQDLAPLGKYLYETKKECYGYEEYSELNNAAENALVALSEYKNDIKRDKEIAQSQKKEVDETLDLLGISKGRK